MENKNPIHELIEELYKMSLEELEEAKPEFLAQAQQLGEPAKSVCVKAIAVVIQEKREQLEKALQATT